MECSNEEIDIHHRAFFSFNPALFLADLSNIAMDVCADGFDDFERNILEADALDQQSKAALQQVILQTCMMTLENLNHAALNFEQYEQLTSMAVPSELFVEQPMPSLPEPVDPEQEAQLDQDLQQLRAQLMQVRMEYGQLKQQLRKVDKDICRTAGRAAAYKPLADVITSASQPLLEEAAAIGALAAKLQPMVKRAQQLQAEQHQPMSQALAAAAAGGEGEGAAAASDAAGSDVERKVRQLMVDTGASLEVLQAANAALEAA